MSKLEPNEVPNKVPEGVELSVFMLAYQHAEYVRQAIESVLMQKTDFKFEICLGEDDSEDGTREICQELAQQFPGRIRLFLRSREDVVYIDGRPTGRYNANMTRKACRGKYVAICECDDFWIDETKLQKQYDFMEANPDTPICATRGVERTCHDAGSDAIRPSEFQPWYGQDWFLQGKAGMLTATVMYRVDAINHNVLYDTEILTVDWAMMLTATESGRRCRILPFVTAVYRIHGNGVWTGIGQHARIRSQKRTLQRYRIHAPENLGRALENRIAMLDCRSRHLSAIEQGLIGRLMFMLKELCSINGWQYLKEICFAKIRRHSGRAIGRKKT